MEPASQTVLSSADPSSFKNGIRRLASGVTVVTTEYGGQRHGLVITGLSSVSTDPPTLMICINKAASSHDAIAASSRFCVNVLRSGDSDLAMRFSSPKRRAERFEGRAWEPMSTGAPALVGCLVSFDCRVTRALDAETHTVFFANVVDIRVWGDARDPLLYWDGAFRSPALQHAT